MSYALHLVVIAAIFLGLAVSLRLLVVDGGLHSFGHAAFYGIGAYAYGLAATRYDMTPVFAALVAVAAALPVCVLLGWVLCRLRKDDFILGSLALQVCFTAMLVNSTAITRGPFGVPNIPALWPAPASLVIVYALGTTLMVALFFWVGQALSAKYFGLALLTSRDSERLASSMGLRIQAVRLAAIAVAALPCLLLGVVYASYVGYIEPSSFALQDSILIYTIVLVASWRAGPGALLGVLVFVLLPEAARFIGASGSASDQLRLIGMGAVLVAMPFIEGLSKQRRMRSS